MSMQIWSTFTAERIDPRLILRTLATWSFSRKGHGKLGMGFWHIYMLSFSSNHLRHLTVLFSVSLEVKKELRSKTLLSGHTLHGLKSLNTELHKDQRSKAH